MVLLSSSFQSVVQLLGTLLIFAFVLVITYLTSKWIGGYQKQSMRNKNLQILESIGIGANKSICLLKAGEEYLVVAIGKDEVTLLTKLTKEQLSEVPINENNKGDLGTGKTIAIDNFQEILEKVRGCLPKK